MTDTDRHRTPTSPALRGLGRRLRTLRVDAGLSGAQIAKLLGWGQSKISKLETGRQVPTADEVVAWAEAAGADPGHLLTLHNKASAEYGAWQSKINDAGSAAAFQDAIATLETSCTFLAEYQPGMIPGRLQTPTYIQQMAAGDEFLETDGISADVISQLIAAKIRRQSILYESGRRIVHVIGEAALRTRIGQMTTDTLSEQLSHLIEVAQLSSSLELGIVPFETALPIAPATSFALYDRDLVIIEALIGDLQLTDPSAVARYNRWIEQLLEVAYTGAAAVDFCRSVRDQLN